MKTILDISFNDAEIEALNYIGKDSNMVLNASDFSAQVIERFKTLGIITVDTITDYPLLTVKGWSVWARLE